MSIPSARDAGTAKGNPTPYVRTRLRLVTASAHERMHAQTGFAAAAAGTISLSDYRLLLSRLYGFHRAFETVLTDARFVFGKDRARSHLIAADLESLALDASEISQLPLCRSLQAPANEAEQLGGLYVLEGSTLGGVHIARALQTDRSWCGQSRPSFLSRLRRSSQRDVASARRASRRARGGAWRRWRRRESRG